MALPTRILIALFALSVVAPPLESLSPVVHAQTKKLTLHPNGFGPHAYASWKAQQGIEDSEGEARMALYLQKMTPTATIAAGIALITGLKGTPVAQLSGLSWEHRIDGHCGAGAPRWNVLVLTPSGERRNLFLGCAAAAHTPGSEPDWIRDSYTAPTLIAIGAANAGFGSLAEIAAIQAGTIQGLQIVFDEGNDQGQGYVFLDNITVTLNGVPHVWTGPMDNGGGPTN
jgi:hypothetical protein